MKPVNAMKVGFEVYAVTNASGSTTAIAHDRRWNVLYKQW